MKRIPGGARAWLPDAKVWLIEREYEPSVRELCERTFWTETLCSTCWAGRSCPELAELAGIMGAAHLTSQRPAPSPPWRPEPPKTLIEAAQVLGVDPATTTTEVVRKVARRMAAAVHPDREGGSQDETVRILAARDLLVAELGK